MSISERAIILSLRWVLASALFFIFLPLYIFMPNEIHGFLTGDDL